MNRGSGTVKNRKDLEFPKKLSHSWLESKWLFFISECHSSFINWWWFFFSLDLYTDKGEGDKASSPLPEWKGKELGLMIHITQGQDFVLAWMEKKVRINQAIKKKKSTCLHKPMCVSIPRGIFREVTKVEAGLLRIFFVCLCPWDWEW